MPKLRIRVQYPRVDLFWRTSSSYPKQHMKMESQATLLFHCTIICSCFTIHTLVISANTQHMFYEHLDHEVEQAGSSNRVVSNKAILLIFCPTQLNVEPFFAVSKIQAHQMLVISGRQGNIPYWRTHICYHGPDLATHAFFASDRSINLSIYEIEVTD